MLTYIDIPDWLSQLYEQSRELGTIVFGQVEHVGSVKTIKRETNLLEEEGQVFIQDGLFQFSENSRLVRMYGAGDWVPIVPPENRTNSLLASDFGADVAVFDPTALYALIGEDPSLQHQWLKLKGYQERIALALAGLYARDEVAPNVDFEQYQAGDTIITEGEEAAEVFELVEGSATVLSGGVQVGKIGAGEFFGELAFLAEEPRTASVVAETNCYVNRITLSEFIRLITARPSMALSLSKTLAKRVSSLNQKLRLSKLAGQE